MLQVARSMKSFESMIKRIIELYEANKPKPEPVAWMSPNKERLEFSRIDTVYGSHTIPLYTTPLTQEPLSEDEMPVGRMAVNGVMLSPDCTTAFILGVRFAEHKHGIGEK